MNTLDQFPAPSSADSSHIGSCHECGRQFIAAEREMCAFVKAVGLLFGSSESLRAEEYWLSLAESADLPLVDGYPVWRNITILAADQLASLKVKKGSREGGDKCPLR